MTTEPYTLLSVRPSEPRRDTSLSWLVAFAVLIGFVWGLIAAALVAKGVLSC